MYFRSFRPVIATSLLALSMSIGASAALAQTASSSVKAAPKAAGDQRFAGARAAIDKILQEAKVPSIAVAVVKDGKIIWEEGFGWADQERKVRSTAFTPYSLASMTKPITATAVMKLREAGKIDIDQPVERYLGDIKLTSGAGSSAGVTPRRIMAHSAGLPLYGHFYLDGSTPAGSKETISKFGMTVFPPGTRFEYSNIGMKILDAAIEQVSGRSYGDYLRREVFVPLGMKNSAVGLPAGIPAAVRYGPDKKPLRFYMTDHPGSGDVWASAHDMARFLAFHMGTPLAGQKPILKPATRLEMQRVASAMPMPGSPRRDIGANWLLSTVNGHPQVWHTGGQAGVSTFMSMYPDQKFAVVVLANASAQLFPVAQAIRDAIAPEVSPRESDEQRPAPAAIPFTGSWTGAVTNYVGQQPISLTFQDGGKVAVQLADQAGTVLNRPAFADGALSGEFAGTSNIPEAKAYPVSFGLKLVQDGGDLVGQLIARVGNDDVVEMLPSFVRLRPATAAR